MALSPRKRWLTAIAVLLVLCLATVIVLLIRKAIPEPKRVLTCLDQSGGPGEIVAKFAVTNVGSASAIAAGPAGLIEGFGLTNAVNVGTAHNLVRIIWALTVSG